MSHKMKLTLGTVLLTLTMLFTLAGRGLEGPLAQMDMPTETMQPPSATEMQVTPSPENTSGAQGAISPTMTSIFTGFTPYPNATYGYYGPMGGSGTGGGCSGMSGGGGMGMSSGYYTDTLTTGGMGSMGSGGMDMGSCPMMSGSMDMTGGSMSGMNMSGVDMPGMDMTGYDLSEVNGYVTANSASVFSNPWVLIGWVLLGLLLLAILAGIGFGIAWLVRRSGQVQTP